MFEFKTIIALLENEGVKNPSPIIKNLIEFFTENKDVILQKQQEEYLMELVHRNCKRK